MKLISVLCLLFLFACGSSQNHSVTHIENTVSEKNQADKLPFNAKITITHFTPYCGGAAPSQHTLDHQTSLQRKTPFLLLNLISGEKTKVKTDTAGILYLNLPKGDFAIRELFKDCTFEEFQAQNPSRQGLYYMSSPDLNCYKNWWEGNLGEIQITNTDSLQVHQWGTSTSCFTGNNPCIYYKGPSPP